MKTFRVTLTKAGAEMSALIGYLVDDWPSDIEYRGDLEMFELGASGHPTLLSSLSRFDQTVRWQAARCGADIVIEDLGGEAVECRDELVMPDDEGHA